MTVEFGIEVIRSLFRTSNIMIVSLIIGFLVLLGVFSNSLFAILTGNCSKGVLLGLLLFPVYLWWLYRESRNAAGHVRLRIQQDDSPQEVRALVIFLSPPPKDLTVEEIKEKGLAGLLADRPRLEKSKDIFKSWFMPFLAFSYHLARLERVVVCPSIDREVGGKNIEGTWRHYEKFEEMSRLLTGKKNISFVSAGDLDERWRKGVDFEDADELVRAVEAAYEYLGGVGINACDILVDITGGQKPPTVAGAAVALAEGRRFQYVSTVDYKVKTYDITYRTDSY